LQQNLQKFLLNTGNAAGSFHISNLKAGDLSQWRDWQTPTLSDNPPSTTTAPTSTTTTSNPAILCRVADAMSSWDTGFTANLTVTNTGASAVNGWAVTFTLPAGQTITNGWNATYSANSGQVTATNMPFNASIPPGGMVTFGFQATHTGNTSKPTSFTLNGNSCATA
jgi:cellulase/cellobiase CelA1